MKRLIASVIMIVNMCVACTMATKPTQSVPLEKNNLVETNEQNAIRFVQNFYTAYTATFYNGASPQTIDSLKKACLTKRLIEKVDRVGSESGGDPIIRAQDFSERIAKTLSYKSLKNDWYLVQYVDSKDTVSIPVKVVKVGDMLMIDYITPFWYDSAFSDSLLISEETNNNIEKEINETTALGFLKQFYAIYTGEYCRMPENLNERLDALKRKFCSERLRENMKQKQIACKAEEPLYDPLILASDFDKKWAKSLLIKPEGENLFSVSYTKNKEKKEFKIAMRKINDKFLVDEIIED